MRRVHLEVGTGCRYRCPFCAFWRRPVAWTHPDRLIAAIEAQDPAATDTLTLGGGDPLCHPELPRVLAAAAARGLARVELRTNAADTRALGAALEAAEGRLSAAVTLPSLDETVAEALSGVPGALARTTAGIELLLAAGAPVSLVVPVTRANVAQLPELVADVARRWPAIRLVELSWYAPADATKARRDPLYVPPREAEPLLRRALARAREAAVSLRFERDRPVVPCVFTDAEGLAGLFLPGAGLPAERRRGPCAECLHAGECVGPTAAQRLFAHGGRVRPVTDRRSALVALHHGHSDGFDSADAAMSVLMQRGEDGEVSCEQVVIRVTERCNQRCPFCWVALGAAHVPADVIRAQIDRATALAPRSVAISGGEPTLLPDLPDLVARLRESTPAKISLQTNAVRLARRAEDGRTLAAALREAGLAEAFVSLHAHEPALYDRCTGTHGQLPSALEGIRAALEAGLEVVVNHVLSTLNLAELPAFARFLATTFDRRAVLNLSLAHPMSDRLAKFATLVPRLSDLEAPLREALEWCLEAGMPFSGLGALCGVPPCLLDADVRIFGPLPERVDAASHPDFEKGPQCAGCALRSRCMGLRSYHVRLHGFDDLRPIRRATT